MPTKSCLECGRPFERSRLDREFCAAPCRIAWNNRRLLRGSLVYDLAMHWRRTRARSALTDLCFVLDGFLADDKTSPRRAPPKPGLVHARRFWALGTGRMPRQPRIPT